MELSKDLLNQLEVEFDGAKERMQWGSVPLSISVIASLAWFI